MKNPFTIKRKGMLDGECARDKHTAMKRMGRKRFLRLFRILFNGRTKLIVPKDLSKITLADLAEMWPSSFEAMQVYPRKNKGPVWYVSGELEEPKPPVDYELWKRSRAKPYTFKEPPDRLIRKRAGNKWGKKALEIYEKLFSSCPCQSCAGFGSMRWCDMHSCENVLDAITYALNSLKRGKLKEI